MSTTTSLLRVARALKLKAPTGNAVSIGSSSATTAGWWRSFSDDATKAPPKGTPYSKLTIGIPKETFALEKRVAASPESVQRLVKPGFNVIIENDAGAHSYFSNADYEAAGATIVDDIYGASDIVMKVCM
jgi:hypothetical protein